MLRKQLHFRKGVKFQGCGLVFGRRWGRDIFLGLMLQWFSVMLAHELGTVRIVFDVCDIILA